MENCVTCGAALSREEVGLSKKLINRATKECKCRACLAAYYQVSEQRLRELAAHWRSMGCELFW
jgi:hypothetical protein